VRRKRLVARQILAHLGLPTRPPAIKPARAPPKVTSLVDEPVYGIDDDPAPDDFS
jgi:hypothetical protein